MMTNHMDVDSYEDYQFSLINAILNREPSAVLYYLRRNANLQFCDENGNTALHIVFNKEPCTMYQREIIKTIEILLNHGMDPNTINNKNRTALHLAIKHRLRDVVDFLIKRGAVLNICDIDGDSTAHFLIDSEFDHFSATCWSINYMSSKKESSLAEGKDFIDWLISRGLDLNYRNKDGITPAHLAARFNFQHILLNLLERGSDFPINYVNEKNQNILHTLIESFTVTQNLGLKNQRKPRSIPFDYDVSFMSRIVKLLLDKGISVDTVDSNGNTVAHLFAKTMKFELVLLVLEKFTNVNACDTHGNTVLHLVLNYNRSVIDVRYNCVKILLSKGANIHKKNNEGLVPLQIAVLRHDYHIVKLLQSYKANFKVSHPSGNLLHLLTATSGMNVKSTPMIDVLIKEGCDIESLNKYGSTALLQALRTCNYSIVDRLIELGANTRAVTIDKYTTLHLAVKNNCKLYYIDRFLNDGVDVNAQDALGRTPLHLSTKNTCILDALLQRRAYVDTYDYEGRLPLVWALRNKNISAIETLLNHGADINDGLVLKELQDLMMHKNIVAMLLEHWLKLKVAGLPCMNEFGTFLDNYCGLHNAQLQTTSMPEFRELCTQEVGKLKIKKIARNVSWYKFMHMNMNRRCSFLAAQRPKQVKRKVHRSSFKLYGSLLIGTYSQTLLRMPLLKDATCAWYRLNNSKLPVEVTEQIFSHLSNVDLSHIKESAKHCRR